MCMTAFCFNDSLTNAANIEVTKEFYQDFISGRVDMWSFVDATTRKTSYEDENFSIEIAPIIETQSFYSMGGVRKRINSITDNLIMCIEQAPLGGNAYYLDCCGIYLTITNKTKDVAILDLNKSIISIGGYSGRPAPFGMRYIDMGSAVFSPIVIPPQTKTTKELSRTDYEFYSGEENASWQHPISVFADSNVFGNGYFVFDIQRNNTDNYVTMRACVVFPSNNFSQYLRNKRK